MLNRKSRSKAHKVVTSKNTKRTSKRTSKGGTGTPKSEKHSTTISPRSPLRSTTSLIASVGIISASLQLMSSGTSFLGNIVNLNHKIRSDRININSPYAPYKGGIKAMESRRKLSTYMKYDNGTLKCWTQPVLGPEQIPTDVDFTNTIVVGYPGADKRVVLRQMEAMTTLSGRDAWDFEFLGMTRQPFIKTNYPHHEGIWGWQDHGDQVMLVIRNIRNTIDSYHDILADIDYAKTWVEATEKIPRLYKGEIVEEHYVRWRDERTMDEIGWYGWLIDYWMEGGILRDYFDHKLTTKEHWDKLRQPETFAYGELQWDVNNCENETFPIVYDEKCDPSYTADCKAKVIISSEHLMDSANPVTAYAEHRKIGTLLSQTGGMKDHLITEDAWDCLYDLMIGNNNNGTADENMPGYHDYRSREGVAKRMHVISTRHLNKMVQQLTRLINKYSVRDAETGIDWSLSEQAQFLVKILTEHRVKVQEELVATNTKQIWAHAPKPNWVVFPKCGAENRRVWDYKYDHEYSGLVYEMFPERMS